MKAGFVVPPLVAAALACAHADPVVITSNGQWATLQEFGSTRKACGVQAGINGGSFLLSGATDRPGVLRLSLYKSTWHIPSVAVPILLSFPDGEALSLNGSGQGSLIRADIPASLVKPLIHRFTADDSATMTLPEGHEAPWRLDLHGTTPAILAMGPCIDAAQILLPPPFRPPRPLPTTVTNTPPVAPPPRDLSVSSSPPTPPQSPSVADATRAEPTPHAEITAPSVAAEPTPTQRPLPQFAAPELVPVPQSDYSDAVIAFVAIVVIIGVSMAFGSIIGSMSGLFILAAALLFVFVFPGINESAPGPCAAVEYHVARAINATDGNGPGDVLGKVLLGAIVGVTHGQIAANYIRRNDPSMPPAIGCAVLYWRMVIDPNDLPRLGPGQPGGPLQPIAP